MSTNTLIIGESGTGKSCSLRNMNHKETFLINVLNKPLPFPKWKNNYSKCNRKNPNGNLFISDDAIQIINTMVWVSEKRPEIKNLILDDYQYILANEFMRKHSNAGKGNAVFALYNSIGDHAWNIIMCSNSLREDLIVTILSHSEENDRGKTKCKTIGRMLDEKITLEGMFTIVLETVVEKGKYQFLTQNNGHNTAKSPMGMFQELIDNDLNFVNTKIREY